MRWDERESKTIGKTQGGIQRNKMLDILYK